MEAKKNLSFREHFGGALEGVDVGGCGILAREATLGVLSHDRVCTWPSYFGFVSRTRMFVVTRAPASENTLAAALSKLAQDAR